MNSKEMKKMILFLNQRKDKKMMLVLALLKKKSTALKRKQIRVNHNHFFSCINKCIWWVKIWLFQKFAKGNIRLI